MQVVVTKNEGLVRELKVTVPSAQWQTRAAAKLADLAGKVRIDGFRPGKVPPQVIQQRYGQSARAEAMEETLQESLNAALEQEKIKPAMQPKISVSAASGDTLEYTAAVEVLPVIPALDLAAVKVTKPVVTIAEKDINEAMDKIALRQTTYAELSKKRAAKKGDQITLNYTALDAATSAELSQEKDITSVLGSDQLFAEVDKALTGKKIGVEAECTIDFTSDTTKGIYNGKSVLFKLELTDIKEPEEMAIDDAFAVKAGFENLEKMREAVGKQIENTYSGAVRGLMKKELLDALDKKTSFDLPPSLVANELEGMLAEARKEKPGSSDDALRSEFSPIAIRRVKLGLALASIGEENNINVTDEEVYKQIYSIARQMGNMAQQVLKFYEGNAPAIQNVRAGLYEDKIIDFIMDKITVTEKSITRVALDKKIAAEKDADDKLIKAAEPEHVHDEHCGHNH